MRGDTSYPRAFSIKTHKKHAILVAMNVGDPQNKIIRIRTFQDDMALARKAKTLIENPEKQEGNPDATQIQPKPKTQIVEKVFAPEKKQETSHTEIAPIFPPKIETTVEPKKIQQVPPIKKPKMGSIEAEISKVAVKQRASILSDADNQYNDESSFGLGSIIRDTQHKRFKFFPSLGRAIVSAVVGGISTFKNRNPDHTVAKAEVRLSTITKAAQNSELAPQEDFSQVAEHLKNVERVPIETAVSFKEKSEVPTPEWSYVIDENSTPNPQAEQIKKDALELLNQENEKSRDAVVESFTVPREEHINHFKSVPTENTSKSQGTITTEETSTDLTNAVTLPAHISSTVTVDTMQQATLAHEVEREQVIDEALHVLFEPSETETTLAEELSLESDEDSGFVTQPAQIALETKQVVDQKSTPVDVVPNRETERRENVQPIIPQTVLTKTVREPRRFRPSEDNNTSPFQKYIFILVIVIASMLGVGVTYYFFTLQHTITQATVYSVPSFIQSTQTIPFPLSADKAGTFVSIQNIVKNSNAVTQMYATVPLPQGGEKPASAEEILSVLQLHAPGSFTRSIKGIAFGSVNEKTPFMIIKATSFDTLFAGMLQWEQAISADLAPLFGTPVTTANFRDAIAYNKNIRVLQDGTSEDRFVYTFIDQSTLLLTTDRKALDILLPLIK